MILRVLLLAAFLLIGAVSAFAVNPDERLADPALEARARVISKELRCLVCQNETIDDSNADLAHDLRVLVRERLKAGDTDRQVLDYLRARYGDYVLLKPPVDRATYLLWFGPGLVPILGAGLVVWQLAGRRRALPGPAPLSDAERARLAALLSEGQDAP
jgi:cytochrome c-type biogenesis protein CcmH